MTSQAEERQPIVDDTEVSTDADSMQTHTTQLAEDASAGSGDEGEVMHADASADPTKKQPASQNGDAASAARENGVAAAEQAGKESGVEENADESLVDVSGSESATKVAAKSDTDYLYEEMSTDVNGFATENRGREEQRDFLDSSHNESAVDAVGDTGSESTSTEEQNADLPVEESEADTADDTASGEAEPVAPEPAETIAAEQAQAAQAVRAQDKHGDIQPSAVRIRGRPGGVLVEIDPGGEWTDVLAMLDERLAAAEGFFRGGKAVLEVDSREVDEDELGQARDLLARHDMTLAVVNSQSDTTLQASLMLGLSTSNEIDRVKPAVTEKSMAPVVPITPPASPYFVHNGTLRSGQVLRKAEGVMIVGDVNPGAKVISGSDIMVWGKLRGMAYAGAGNNPKALVAALEFAPTQLRIANVTAVAPEKKQSRGMRFWRKQKEPERRAEVAHISDGQIVVEPWDDSRPGRPKIARR